MKKKGPEIPSGLILIRVSIIFLPFFKKKKDQTITFRDNFRGSNNYLRPTRIKGLLIYLRETTPPASQIKNFCD